jgi:hypothetical protein
MDFSDCLEVETLVWPQATLPFKSREFLEEFVLPMVEDALHSTRPPHQDISEVTRLLELVIMGIDQEIILLKR